MGKGMVRRMNLIKADYWTVIMFGSLESFIEKLTIEKKQIDEIVNLVDEKGVSLLQQSLSSRKFDIANLLLDKGATVNHISTEGCNELHYIAAHIDDTRAIQLTYRLIVQGVDLDLKDNKYGNSAIFTLCYEAFKVGTKEANDLIVSCLKKQPNLETKNKSGYSLKQVIEARGTEHMKKALEISN